ncbi:MAG: tautomerase family protein [Brucella sp.]
MHHCLHEEAEIATSSGRLIFEPLGPCLIPPSLDDPEMQQQFLVGCSRVLEPYVAGRGYRWELHVDDTPFDLWMINGLKPPHPGTPAELKWRSENRPSTY